MKTGFPPCEGLGPELVAAYVMIRINRCPLVVCAGGMKFYILVYGDGSLVLADEHAIADALALVDVIAPEINADRLAGADWSATPQSSESFRSWVDQAIAKWRSLQ